MRYLQIISSLNPEGGGTVEGVRQLCAVTAAHGHAVEVATLDAAGEIWGDDIDCPVHRLGPPTLGTYSYSPALKPWLSRNGSRFDAVVVNGLWQYHALATWQALRHTATPYFVFTHGMLDPWFRRQYPLKHLKKWLYWPWADYRVLRDAAAVLFTCEEERRLARESFWLYQANEAVVSCGTPGPGQEDASVQRAAFLREFPMLEGKRLLLFLGRVHEKKGCDLLVDAFAAVARDNPDLHLVMAGPDPGNLGMRYAQRSDPVYSSRITWTGMLQGEMKWGALRSAEAFVLPSHQENFGIAVTEALACGVPVLISNCVNIWWEIERDAAGMVEADTAEGTRRLLTRWIALKADQRNLMAARARQSFLRRFHIDTAAQKLFAVLGAHAPASTRLTQAAR